MVRHPTTGWNARLHDSVDGFELREARGAWPSCAWVEDPYLSIPSDDWIKYHHVRINALPSLMRSTRGQRRAQADVRCRAGCARAKTTAHIIQECYRTHGGWVLRHDAVAAEISRSLALRGWTVLREKVFRTGEGNRKPDIIASRQGIARIVDVQVVSGTRPLAISDGEKTAYYRRNADLRDGIRRLLGAVIRESDFGSVTISWRGVWAPASVTLLTRMGIPKVKMKGLTIRVFMGSYINFARFNAVSSRSPAWRAYCSTRGDVKSGARFGLVVAGAR